MLITSLEFVVHLFFFLRFVNLYGFGLLRSFFYKVGSFFDLLFVFVCLFNFEMSVILV